MANGQRPSSLRSPLLEQNELLRTNPSYQSLARRSSTWKRANVLTQKPSAFRRLQYYVPVLHWLPNYAFTNFIWDILAGCSTACLSIPIALTYSQTFLGIPPVYSLMGASISPILYSLFTASPLLSVGPEAGICLLIAGNIHQRIVQESESPEKMAILITGMITFLTGLFTLAAGTFRLGFLDALVSPVLLRGCILSISLIIMINQASVILGLTHIQPVKSDLPIEKVIFILRNISESHRFTCVISIIGITLFTAFRLGKTKLSTRFPRVVSIPDTVLILLGAALLSKQFHWHSVHGVPILGKVETKVIYPKIPFPEVHRLKFISESLQTGLTCAFLSFIETVIAIKALSTQRSQIIRSNRELLSLGIANIGGSLFSGLPICGGYLRSKCNILSGARTQVSAIACGIIVLLATLYILPVFSHVPSCLLAAMVVSLALSLLTDVIYEIASLVKLHAFYEILIILSIATITLMLGLETGIIFGLGLTVLQIIRHAARSRIMFRTTVDEDEDAILLEDHASCRSQRINTFAVDADDRLRVLVVRIPEPLFFANVSQLEDRLSRLEKYGHPRMHPGETPYHCIEDLEVIVFDMVGVSSMDSSALFTFRRILIRYKNYSTKVYLVSVDPSILRIFEKHGLIDIIGGFNHVFESMKKLDAAPDLETGFS
ncbi:sulfate transporter [Schizosaccharomyces cryophilus OY26]|uniref:Sulfate transporter n=1 Tax=Schizosaccharomyces cryophilus (strain OY26 / ATCC MYA-4695 / CBS 11777 / NBRC 106824 / NRRL Y48691) TaxID=653667 RepID=S9VV44_SCHCR|nr:sulfate transporter [Schizosaccharomyces cryophilus OY26]EPY50064.1 sulfate transporter [Schizosaccharomyces cryophilus OY26]